jgi:VanZ family protein
MAGRSRHRSSATPLAAVYAALVVYASLFPFTGWRWPPGQALGTLLVLPWPPYVLPYDLWFNLVGYLPLGALTGIAVWRSGGSGWAALFAAVLGPAALSFCCEVLQQFLPGRHASLRDLAMNSAGAALGAALALGWLALGGGSLWQALRERWFLRDSAGALALLALWPVGLLFPAPVPLGLGQISGRLREAAQDLLDGVPWADAVYLMLAAPATAPPPLRPLAETGITALGLLAPCLLAYSVMKPGWRRVAMSVGALALAVTGMTLSTLLNFGPQHFMAWVAPGTPSALAAGVLLAALLAPLSRPVVVGLALVALTGLVVGVAHAPDDPYFAQSLQAWEQGRFVRFHGLAQWVGWLWPYAAMAWLLSRLGRRS